MNHNPQQDVMKEPIVCKFLINLGHRNAAIGRVVWQALPTSAGKAPRCHNAFWTSRKSDTGEFGALR